jgi:hypothetical protein
MVNGDHIGPVLHRIAPADLDSLQALFAEQRARLDVVRSNRIWQWFGGVPDGFGSPKAPVHAVYLQLAFVALVGLTLVVAGCTRGPWLWATGGLAVACPLARALVFGRPVRQTLAFYERAVQMPGILVACAPELAVPASTQLHCAAVLVARGGADARGLENLIAAGEEVRRWLSGVAAVPDAWRAVVAEVQRGLAAKDHDGSRIAVPDGLPGGAYEIARVRLATAQLPGEALTSRLVFVFADPLTPTPGHARVLHHALWGGGVETLCAALPWEVAT